MHAGTTAREFFDRIICKIIQVVFRVSDPVNIPVLAIAVFLLTRRTSLSECRLKR